MPALNEALHASLTLRSPSADHRRIQRSAEIQTMHDTLTSLRSKKTYLVDQIRSYHEYIDQSMASIQRKSYVSPPVPLRSSLR